MFRVGRAGAKAGSALAMAVLGCAAVAQQAGSDTHRAPTMREAIYVQLDEAQQCMAAEDFACARGRVDGVVARGDLSGYERAMAAQMSAFVSFRQGEQTRAIADYEVLLAQPGVPEHMRLDALYTLGQLQAAEEQHEQALDALDRWFELTAEPSPEAWAFRAQIQYQLERWADGAASIGAALSLAEQRGEQPAESWRQLDAVFGYEIGGCERAYDSLETLMRLYPKREYYVQAAGCAGANGDNERQLELMDIAAASGLLGAHESFTYAFMLLREDRHGDARRAVTTGARLLDGSVTGATRRVFEEAADLIAAERYGEAASALNRGLETLQVARDGSTTVQ